MIVRYVTELVCELVIMLVMMITVRNGLKATTMIYLASIQSLSVAAMI